MKSKNLFVGLFSGMLLASVLSMSSPADARIRPTVTYGAEFISDFSSSCTVIGGLTKLPNSEDTIDYFVSRMKKYGNSRSFKYGNALAETTDVSAWADLREGYRGMDYRYADDVEVYAIDTHGGRSSEDNNISLSMCTPTSWSYNTRNEWGHAHSHLIRWGDGRMRWALLYACYSAEEPHLAWMDSFGPHFEVLMGFNGLAYDYFTTDENLGDWVDEVYDDGRSFKGAWFYANEDWRVPDMDATLVAAGDNLAEATARRDNQTVYYHRRNGADVPGALAWASKLKRKRERKFSFERQ